MKYFGRVLVCREFGVEFPEELFTEENLEYIRSYSLYFKDMSVEDIKYEIINTYSVFGAGYYEQYGCNIGNYEYRDGFPLVKIINEDYEVDDSYLEPAE